MYDLGEEEDADLELEKLSEFITTEGQVCNIIVYRDSAFYIHIEQYIFKEMVLLFDIKLKYIFSVIR